MNQKTYIGLCSTDFKSRFNNHKSSFYDEDKETETKLSKYIWKLSREEIEYEISWKICSLAPAYKKETQVCNLCLMEKTLILLADKNNLLNKRQE